MSILDTENNKSSEEINDQKNSRHDEKTKKKRRKLEDWLRQKAEPEDIEVLSQLTERFKSTEKTSSNKE